MKLDMHDGARRRDILRFSSFPDATLDGRSSPETNSLTNQGRTTPTTQARQQPLASRYEL
jgi:hypothetical protein